jgi:putative restriction endonuclease
MRAYVGVTDRDWFESLLRQPDLDEVNFWQPGGQRHFSALARGELFLFKLHSPNNFVVGGGLFSYSTLLQTSMVWEAFMEKNGAKSLSEMRIRIEKYRKRSETKYEDYVIGNILLSRPFFFSRDAWIPIPSDWSSNIVSGKRYDLSIEPGRSLWNAVNERLQRTSIWPELQEGGRRYGDPILITPRLGQGGFRVLVTDTYSIRCAITGERTLPVLEAVHIKPYADGGEHRINNGILFRSDIHTLFDQGFVTVDTDFRFEVSKRIREDFENGRDYYKLAGARVNVPLDPAKRPDSGLLRWHNENRFLG